MSKRQTHPDSLYGIQEFDLSEGRDKELVQLPSATYLATLEVPGEATLRLGSETAKPIDVRDLDSIKFSAPIGQLYLSNPATSGTLRILAGKAGNVEVSPEETIDTIENIAGTVSTDPSDRQTREIGKIRSQDSGGSLIDPATEPTLSAIAGSLGSNATDSILVQENTPLDVSAATVGVQEATPLDVSGATVNVQEATPLDVSGATVTTDPTDGDAGAISGAALAGNGTVTVASLSAVGADSLHGQVSSTGSYDVSVDWQTSGGTVVRTETIASAVTGGTWTDLNIDAKAAYADVIITDTSGASQTADGTAHLG